MPDNMNEVVQERFTMSDLQGESLDSGKKPKPIRGIPVGRPTDPRTLNEIPNQELEFVVAEPESSAEPSIKSGDQSPVAE
jgi:hypothetical protein